MRRMKLWNSMEKRFLNDHSAASFTAHNALYRKAADMMRPEVRAAFDLSQEEDAVREKYGPGMFGQGCLLARRLVERGVPFVEVSLGAGLGWDTHQDNFERSRNLTGQIDQPMAELVRDLRDRGLLENTLVVWMGEFGRTPKINPRVGRDHFPRAFSVALAGCGVRGGQVIGATNDAGQEVADRPVTVHDLFQSIYHALGIDAEHENMSRIGRPIKLVDGGEVVRELFS